MRSREFLFLRRQLAGHAVAGIRDRFVQVAGAALHPLSLTLFLKEGCKQCTEAVRLRDVHQTLVLRHRKEGEVEHRTVLDLGQQERLGSVILDIRHEIVVHLAELLTVLIRHACDRLGCVTGRAEGQFAAEQRRKTQKLTEQPAVERLPFFRLRCGGGKSCAGNRERVVLVLCGRHAVKQTGQNLPLAGQVAVYTAQSVNNAVVLAAQDDVGVLAHQLADEVLFAGYTHFIRRIQFDGEHTLDRRLAHCRNLCALHMLAQQHAEHRRRRRILSSRVNEMHARRACRDRQQQSARTALTAACLQHDFIAVRLIDLLYTTACQYVIEFICHCPQADRI